VSMLLWMAVARSGHGFRASSMRRMIGTQNVMSTRVETSTDLDSLIYIKNTQKKFPIDIEKVRVNVSSIKRILGVSDFKVDIWFCSDEKIRELNSEWREKSKATDVLSFPANDFKRPGVFNFDDDPTMQFEKHLGDIVISPAYVNRQSERDKKSGKISAMMDLEDRGVSLAMSRTYSLDERISLLLVHGMIHLLGYDHEKKKDWALMTEKEDQVIAALWKNADSTDNSQPRSRQL